MREPVTVRGDIDEYRPLRGSSEDQTMIEVRKVTKDYGTLRAVDQIDFDVESGQVVGILGPNGAGKTTTLRILTGYMPPTSGLVKVNGFNVFSQSLLARASIGYLPESNPLYGEMRVREQLHYFGKLHGMDRTDRHRRIAELTDRCGLSQIIDRPIAQLSKGNKQRVGLSQALLHDPPVLVLDEPTIGLDPAQMGEVRRLICELSQRKTVLLSTHILHEVERVCQRVIIISGGKLVADGTPDELRAKVRKSSRVLIEVKAAEKDVRQVFGSLQRVGTLEADEKGGWCHVAVTPHQTGDDLRELLAELAARQSWPIREVRHEIASLEEYFVQVTDSNQAQAA
jgi:ABC-2 type transport system ATP-binding protein